MILLALNHLYSNRRRRRSLRNNNSDNVHIAHRPLPGHRVILERNDSN